MNRYSLLIFLLVVLLFDSCTQATRSTIEGKSSESAFSFAFLTDVHLNKDNHGNGNEGLAKALADAKTKGVDFVIFGGDLANLDGLKPEQEATADSLLARFKSIVDKSGVPAYFTIGNHDRYYTSNGQPDPAGFKMFQKHLGETYYSFDHKGVHFIVLNSVQRDAGHTYFVNDEQFTWLKNDLSEIGENRPLVVSTHVPFQSLYYPAVEGRITATDMLENFKEVWDLLLNHNLKVILQGHQHLHEELFVKDTWFLTGGAVSAGWWRGEFHRTQEGYMLVNVDAEGNFSWEYIDYGWEVN
jgi:3',5'-cyclic AMP phosphodiesterase CpdA